mmetsp:Transcript_132363/g.247441  ORF Transcript_132363/g.247441 Transcript_132363/m.247441 type:complete len:789 (-) Transcript_132363:241-2607(-)
MAEALLRQAEDHLWNEEYVQVSEVLAEAKAQGASEEDTLRLEILAKHQGVERSGSEAATAAEEARSRFYAEEKQRAEAVMLLTLAEVSNQSTVRKREQALSWLQKAMGIFDELGELRYKGLALLAKATVHYHKEDRDGVLQFASAALAVFAKLGDTRHVGICHLKIALAHVLRNDWKAALQKGDQALTYFKQSEAKSLQVSTLCAMSEWHVAQQKLDEALAKAQNAMAICLTRQEDLPAREAKALKAICEALGEMDRLEDAIKVVNESSERCRQADNKRGLLAAMDNLWQLERAQEAYSQALDTGDEILEIVKDLQDKRAKIKAYFDLHEIYMSKKDTQSAMECLEVALEVTKTLDDPLEESMILQWLANMRIYKEEYQQALNLSASVKELALSCDDETGRGASLLLTCGAHAANAELEEGFDLAVQAQELFKAIGHKSNEAVAWGAMAQIQMMNRKYDSGLHSYTKALSLWRSVRNKAQMHQTMFEIAHVHLMLKNHVDPERLVLQLGRYTYGKPRQECNRLCLFTQVCLLARANEIEHNPRVSGEALDKAFRAANKANTLADEIKDKGFKAMATFTRAQVTNANGLLDRALDLAEEAQKLFKEVGHQCGQAQVMAFVATVNFNKGNLQEAQDLGNKALELARKHGDFCAQDTAMELQEEIEEKRKAQAAVVPVGYVVAPAEGGDAVAQAKADVPASVAVPEAKATLDPIVVGKQVLNMMMEAVASDDEIFMDTDVIDTGLDSLASMELVSQLSRQFKGFHLSPTLLFDFPTTRQIGDHLAELSNEA